MPFNKKKANLAPRAGDCKKSRAATLLILTGLALALPAVTTASETPVHRMQSAADRAATQKALQAAMQNEWSYAEKLVAETRDPLAAKLYHWLIFTRGPKERAGARFVTLSHFIRQNPEWPEMRNLRIRAEKVMPAAQPADDIIAWFADYPPVTTDGMDRYVAALVAKGRKEQAKKTLGDWWAATPLSREDQRNIYNKYKTLIDREAHVRRLDSLLLGGHYTNARAVAAVLENGYPQLAEARIALAEEKGNVNSLIDAVPASLQSDPGLLYERLRWRRRNDMNAGALEILRQQPPAEKLQNLEAWWQERHILIRRLLEEKKYKGAYILASEHKQKDGLAFAQGEWLAGWLALRFLGEPTTALQHFEVLYNNVSTPISISRGAYWAGRAAAAIGNDSLAKDWYRKAAKHQTVYYGQLAAAELRMAHELPDIAPPSLSKSDKEAFDARELIQAARLFHAAGMRDEASIFIRAFVKHENTPKAYRYAAETAAEMGRYHDAIRIAKDATKDGMFLTAQSYPVITDKLRGIKTEWAFVHSIIRQESMFDDKAISPAGARGLMQLMPGTAKDVAKRLKISHNTNALTDNPAHNIKLGTAYLQEMIERFGGNYTMAAAAYNAGPARVEKWNRTFGDPRLGEIDMIDWIELIPIYETRNYAQRVLENVYIYRLRLEGQQEKPVLPIHIAMP